MKTLINSGSKVNAIIWLYITKIKLKIWFTDVRTQKIDSFILETFGMVLANFQVKNKLGKTQLFQEIFLVAKTSEEVILKMFFLIFSNADMVFKDWKLI